jgi:hypothetical protein
MLAAKVPDALTDEERAGAQAELANLIGAEEAAKFSWLKRLALAADGSVLIEIKVPRVPRADLRTVIPAHENAPWAFPDRSPLNPLGPGEGGRPGMLADIDYRPLAEAVELLRGPDSPEAEIKRRFDCLYERVEMQNAEARRVINARETEREARKAREAGRAERWRDLPRDAKVFYLAAESTPRTPSQALLEVARLLTDPERALEQVPRTFEPEGA